ncbi:hypothetical protein VP01_185g3 [Puccinia sorghi]|uniref:Uncharacterized protein n=1 Tax=Puccinia sorghi TaxID=27349 RepID=A0A0L6VDE9_9BASI|nr:hypothetical protein VP01_185g3 [Puccinia sorghi]
MFYHSEIFDLSLCMAYQIYQIHNYKPVIGEDQTCFKKGGFYKTLLQFPFVQAYQDFNQWLQHFHQKKLSSLTIMSSKHLKKHNSNFSCLIWKLHQIHHQGIIFIWETNINIISYVNHTNYLKHQCIGQKKNHCSKKYISDLFFFSFHFLLFSFFFPFILIFLLSWNLLNLITPKLDVDHKPGSHNSMHYFFFSSIFNYFLTNVHIEASSSTVGKASFAPGKPPDCFSFSFFFFSLFPGFVFSSFFPITVHCLNTSLPPDIFFFLLQNHPSQNPNTFEWQFQIISIQCSEFLNSSGKPSGDFSQNNIRSSWIKQIATEVRNINMHFTISSLKECCPTQFIKEVHQIWRNESVEMFQNNKGHLKLIIISFLNYSYRASYHTCIRNSLKTKKKKKWIFTSFVKPDNLPKFCVLERVFLEAYMIPRVENFKLDALKNMKKGWKEYFLRFWGCGEIGLALLLDNKNVSTSIKVE